MPEPATRDPWQPVHGALLLAAMAVPVLLPGLGSWPWYLLVPLLLYSGVVLAVPPLRRSVHWLRVGNLDGPRLAVTAGIVAASAAALILYYYFLEPDLQPLADKLPLRPPWPVLLGGVCFAVGNALMEEALFRGILQDAVASQVGVAGGVLAQAVVFGIGHAQGYPPGPVGAVLAGIYGLMLGGLRVWSGGLGCGILAHIAADATIFAIIVHAT